MKKMLKHFRVYIFRGILASIPLGMSYVVLKFLYIAVDRRVTNLIDRLIGVRIPGVGLLSVLLILFIIGYLASNIIGKRLLGLIERVADRIPIVKTTYQVGKQLSFTLSLPEQQVFKRVVLVDYFKPGIWIIGFVTGTILDKKNNEKLLKVFIPTVPNPTSGMMVILKESQVMDSNWPVEEAMKMVISGGIIGPDSINRA